MRTGVLKASPIDAPALYDIAQKFKKDRIRLRSVRANPPSPPRIPPPHTLKERSMRMICFGAQSVPGPVPPSPPPVISAPCRRAPVSGEERTFTRPIDEPTTTAAADQLGLF